MVEVEIACVVKSLSESLVFIDDSGTSSKDLMIFSIKFKMKVIMHYMTLSVYRLMSNRFLFPLMSEHFATV